MEHKMLKTSMGTATRSIMLYFNNKDYQNILVNDHHLPHHKIEPPESKTYLTMYAFFQRQILISYFCPP